MDDRLDYVNIVGEVFRPSDDDFQMICRCCDRREVVRRGRISEGVDETVVQLPPKDQAARPGASRTAFQRTGPMMATDRDESLY